MAFVVPLTGVALAVKGRRFRKIPTLSSSCDVGSARVKFRVCFAPEEPV